MAVRFATFEPTNTTGLRVTVKLEAPVGTLVHTYTVGPNATGTFNPGVSYVPSARVEVDDGTRQTTQELSAAGNPYDPYIESLISEYNVGSIQGEMKTRY